MPSTAYLMLARHDDGRPLDLTIASDESLASFGPFRWERAPKPYAKVTAATLDDAYATLVRRLITDTEPWPDELVPLVEALLGAQKTEASPYRRAGPGDASNETTLVEFNSAKGRSRRARVHNRIRFLVEQCKGGVAKGEASALRWLLDLAGHLAHRVGNLEAHVQGLESERREAVRIDEIRRSQLAAADREIASLRAVIDPRVRQACTCCRKCGPTVPCAAAIESLGEVCEGRCYCGVDGQLELPADTQSEEPCES